VENRSPLWRSRLAWTLALLGSAFSLHASTITDDVTVLGTSMPWQFNTTTFNSSYQYGLGDGTAPIVISALSGISFAPGGTLVITFLGACLNSNDSANCVSIDTLSSTPVGGPVMPGVSSPYEDARGYTPSTPIPYNASNNPGTSGKDFPSFYMNPASYPIYLGSLVGVFTDSSGNIVGTPVSFPPFVINDGPTNAVIPAGATQLQIGIDDDIFYDNGGSYSVQVQGPDPTPEPGSFLLIGFPLLALAAFEYRRRAAKVQV
jgi:hypothetical protein